jgi:hypothetical protein
MKSSSNQLTMFSRIRLILGTLFRCCYTRQGAVSVFDVSCVCCNEGNKVGANHGPPQCNSKDVVGCLSKSRRRTL